MKKCFHRQTLFSQSCVALLMASQPLVTLQPLLLQAQVQQNVSAANTAPLPDAFKEDWTPPKPVLTPREITLNRAVVIDKPTFELARGRSMTEADVKSAKVLGTPLRSTGGLSADEAERDELGQRLLEHVSGKGRNDHQSAAKLKGFVNRHPGSGYATSLLIEAGEIEWVNGFFMDSLDTFQRAWDGAKNHAEADDRRLAEMALGRLLERRALLGQKEELRALLAEVKGRPLGGYAEDARVRASEVMWYLDHKAERNVFCGFTAANAVCVPLGERPIFPDVHDDNEKAVFIRDGLSAFELAAHSHEGGGTLRVIRRGAGAKIVVPSIMHWSFKHYSAITEELDGKYRVKDEHLRFDSWVPKEVIDGQSSGCFLVPAAVAVPEGYTAVSDAEAKTIFGRHCTHARDAEGTQKKKCDPCDPCCKGMATYNFDLMNPGLYLQDMPVGYTPPYGPAVQFTAAYSQRSTVIADLQTFGNLGPRWTHTYQEVVSLSGTGTPNSLVKWIQSDGSYFDYSYVTASQTYAQKYSLKDRPRLNYLAAGQGGPGYELRFSDGSRKLFTQPNSGTPTKYLLTQIIDPTGNALTLQYDGSLRLTTILDALAQPTTISYATEAGDNVTGDTLKIRKVTDPFSRVAKFKYTPTGQLEKIIDPVLIESKFHYASGDFIDRLTTPYGVTEFTQGDLLSLNAAGPGRFIESRDAAGDRERVEANDFALPDGYQNGGSTGGPVYTESPLAPSSVSVNGTSVLFLPKNDNLFYRNTFFWDKKQMFYAAGDYSQARIYNWLASTGDTISSVLGSMREPLEGRVWFNYPGQTSAHSIGDVTSPSKTVRAVEGAGGATTWVMSQASYNDLGLPTGTVDPEGREMKYEYYMAADGTQFNDNQDVHYVKVKNGANWETLMTISQYKIVGGKSVHLPEIMTDAAGVQTTMSYNDKGQVASETVSKGGNTETTNYIYDSNLDGTPDAYGYLIRVEHTSPVNAAQFVTLESRTYDSAKRVRTVTDADGYTLTYDYDSLDRVTLVTHPDSTTEQIVYTDGTKQTLDVWASKDRAGRWTRTRYNALRQPVMQLDSLARLTQWEWCKCGSLSKLIDAQGKVTFWKRDIQGRVTDKILPDTKKYSYTYQTLSGRVATVAYPADVVNNQTTFTNEYYSGGQLKKKDYRDAAMADVNYGSVDYLGRPTTVTDGTGTTTSSYVSLTTTADGAGQTATVDGPLSHDTLRYSYDWQGRVRKQEIVSDDGTTASRSEEATTRDSLGRVTQMVNNLGTFTSTFNTGNLSAVPNSVALPGGFSTVLTRYAANTGANALRLQTIDHKQGTSTVQKHDYAFNLTGNLTTWNRTNAASVVTGWTLRHDNADQLTDLDETVGGTATKKESWHYDTAGNIASSLVEPTGQSASLRMRQHTGRNQLTSMGGAGKTLVEGTTDEAATVTVNSQPATVTKLGPSGPWRFQKEMDFPNGQTSITVVATDGSNNVRTKSYTVTVDAAHGARTLEYDDNGNLRRVRDGSNAVIRLCEWDAENHLLAVQSAELLANGVKRSEFSYDGVSRRVRQVEKEHNGSAWVTQSDWTYIWDGLELVQKRDTASGTALANYFGSGEQQGSDAIVYLTDHLGSVCGWYRVIDGVRGDADFSAYGQRTITTTGPGVPERGYTGHFQHAASGLILAPFRAYDAELGRWLNEDPNGEDGGINLYMYVGGGVVGRVDPLGLEFHWYDAFNWYADHGGTAANNFLGGFSNSWLMGAPNLVYGAAGLQGADPCSGWTTAGDWTATGIAVASSMGSGALKKAAAQRFGGLSRKQVTSALRADRAQLRKALGGATGDGLQAHHSNPLLGHPGSGASTMFPTAGLPAAVRNSPLNGQLLDQAAHMAAHARMEAMEAAMRGLGLGSNSASAARAAMSAYRTQNCN